MRIEDKAEQILIDQMSQLNEISKRCKDDESLMGPFSFSDKIAKLALALCYIRQSEIKSSEDVKSQLDDILQS